MRAILFDMDGVLYNDDRPIPRAAETIAFLRAHDVPHLFVTNTSSKPRRDLVDKLATFHIPAVEEQILTPTAAAADYLRQHGKQPIALFTQPPARAEFAGLNLLPDDAEQGAAAVVIGDMAELWTFATINRAFRILHHTPDAELIALGMTKYWRAADGISLDVAPFVAALQHATGRKPLVFGKPAARFFESAAARLNVTPSEILMIGDDIEADVAGAQAAGLKGALVKTGKFRPADLHRSITPDFVLDSVADLPAIYMSGW